MIENAEKENQRVRMSKIILRNSLISLLMHIPICKISIREICDHAQINRSTFYRYYGSQYDLLADIENEFTAEIEKYVSCKMESENDQLTSLLSFLESHRDLCRILLNNNVDPEFTGRLMNLPSIKTMVSDKAGCRYSSKELEYLYGFISTGGFHIIRDWINRDCREQPEELAEFISGLIHNIIQ